jgi:hypothetical protein
VFWRKTGLRWWEELFLIQILKQNPNPPRTWMLKNTFGFQKLCPNSVSLDRHLVIKGGIFLG